MPHRLLRRPTIWLAALALPPVGCAQHQYAQQAAARIHVPPPGTVPVELAKVTLPPYVIEPPDALLIEVVQIIPDPNAEKRPGETDTAFAARQKEMVAVTLPLQPVSGQFAVGPDGTVMLGIWGRVTVAGLTMNQAAEAIREHIARQEDATKPGTGGLKKETLRVVLDTLQINSKQYFVITDGGGSGEGVYAFPVTGSETVLNAIANIGGLPPVASKRNVWVARRTPHAENCEQILPVDWVGITQHGITRTNYQLMPGDRVYVKAQRLVTLDTFLTRLFTPVERVFGVTLLGTNTVNNLQGRGFGFNNNN